MAGPLSQMYKAGRPGTQAQPAIGQGPGQAQQVHGPASIHDPSVAFVEEVDAILADKMRPIGDRRKAQTMKFQIKDAHEGAAILQQLDELRKGGTLSAEDTLELKGLREEILDRFKRMIEQSELTEEAGF